MIVTLTGAIGSVLRIKPLVSLRQLNVETHSIISKWVEASIKHETDYAISNVHALAGHIYNTCDRVAPIFTGLFSVTGMIVVPCSAKSLASINSSICDDLVFRAADVMFKEWRRLVLGSEEGPLSVINLQSMPSVTQAGAIVFPLVPAIYISPSPVNDFVDCSVRRMLY